MNQSNTFTLAGQLFSEGDTLQILTPELGSLQVTAQLAGYGTHPGFALKLGDVITPIGHTAGLSFYTNGQGYSTLTMWYQCGCPESVHNHILTWYNLQIVGNTITTHNLGVEFNQPHRHPTVTVKLPQLALPAISPEPTAIDRKGQFLLF